MARPDKVAAVAELSEKFTNSAGIVLTEYRGLTVKAIKQLRRSLGEDATYSVSKNTLTTIAARAAGVEGIEEHLLGPTAIAFIDGDPVVVAKGLRDFARTNPQLVIKGGVLDGKFLNADDVKKLADLESREVLLAKVAGGMQGVLQQAISLVSAPLSQAARLLAALEEAAASDPTLIGGTGTSAGIGGPGTPAAATPETDQPETDQPEAVKPEADQPETDQPETDQPETNEEPVAAAEETSEPAVETAAPAAADDAAPETQDN